ncbi:isoprenyl transferase [Parapedomonas caeni]
MTAISPSTVAAVAVPRHVAIIMDGNGRWAKRRLLPRALGHRQGAEAVRRIVQACVDLGVQYLTLYAFSSENWKRPTDEVEDLMGLLRHYLRNEVAELNRNNVRLRIIGERRGLAPDVVALVNESEGLTRNNTGLTLVLALNYGAQAEIAAAVRAIAAKVQAGVMPLEAINEQAVADHLLTVGIPDPDLIIRTSGEQRLSNFLLWQAAYAELVFVDCLWPDFDKAQLVEAIETFGRRERRFGGRG